MLIHRDYAPLIRSRHKWRYTTVFWLTDWLILTCTADQQENTKDRFKTKLHYFYLLFNAVQQVVQQAVQYRDMLWMLVDISYNYRVGKNGIKYLYANNYVR